MEASATGADYYAVLGVARTSTHAEILSSYRKLARLKHPDKNPENANATAEFQNLQEAYSVLSNDDKRREYDRVGPYSFRNSQQPDRRHAKRAFKKTFFAFHVNPSWTGAQNPIPDWTRSFHASRHGQQHQHQQKPNPFNSQPNEQQPPKDQREPGHNHCDSHPQSPTSPGPPDCHQPTPLEQEMRQKREQIRTSERTIAHLQTKQAQLARLLDTTWQQISLLTGSLGRIDEERQQLQKNPSGRDWFEELFGPMPTEAEMSSVQGDMDKLSHRHKQLSDAVAGLQLSLEAHTTQSRDLVSQMQRENECQTELKKALHQLCCRWRAEEFFDMGADAATSEEDPLGGLNDWSGWTECDGWFAWDEPLSYEEDKEPIGSGKNSKNLTGQGTDSDKGVGLECSHDGWIDDMYAQDEATTFKAPQEDLLEVEIEKEEEGKEDDDGNESDSNDEDEDDDEDYDDEDDDDTDDEGKEEEEEEPLIDMEWDQNHNTFRIGEVQWHEW